jgi:hypothetical protein
MFEFLVLSGLVACLGAVGCFVVSGLYAFDKKISNRNEAGYNDHDEDMVNRLGIILHQVLKDNRFDFGY